MNTWSRKKHCAWRWEENDRWEREREDERTQVSKFPITVITLYFWGKQTKNVWPIFLVTDRSVEFNLKVLIFSSKNRDSSFHYLFLPFFQISLTFCLSVCLSDSKLEFLTFIFLFISSNIKTSLTEKVWYHLEVTFFFFFLHHLLDSVIRKIMNWWVESTHFYAYLEFVS